MRRLAPFLGVLALLAVALVRDGVAEWVARTELPPLVVDTGIEMRDRHGVLLRAFTVADGRWRLPVTPDAVDPRFVEMLVAYEDRRFWTHGGVDPLALLRAAGQALRAGRVVSGGSTLTMQVARLLEDGPTGQWAGKLRQMRVALALERRLSKAEILGLYLHLAPYGGNLEGVRAATLAWLGKEPARLTPAEAALLVALPQAPEARRPDRARAVARAARDRVLARMVGAGVLGADAAKAAGRDPVPVRRAAFPALAPHLADHLRAEDPLRRSHRVTLEAQVQQRFEALAAEAVAGREAAMSVAILAADHRTGQVVASVGSAGYAADARQGFVDMTRARRSPGSTLKPLVYAMAFDQGLAHPQTVMTDRPVAFGSYAPRNFDGLYRGDITVEEALRQSLNIPVVLLTEEIGPARLMAALRRAGAQPALPSGKPGLAVALGGVGLSLHDLVALYAALARGGEAIAVTHRADAAPAAATARVVSRAAAWQVGHILSGIAPPPAAPRLRLAYKTGTSYGHRDAWAIGFDGRHVVGVWMGRPDGTPVPGAFGGDLAAPVLFRAFQRLGQAPVPMPPPPPETLILPTAQLPAPLRRFTGRHAVFAPSRDAPKLAFPPDGARLEMAGGPLVIKLRDGIAPFTVLANGVPVLTNLRVRELTLPAPGPGYSVLSVIDARGRSDRIRVELR